MPMNEEVRKAAERMTANMYDPGCVAYMDAQTIRTELARLYAIADSVDPLVVRLGEVTEKLERAEKDAAKWKKVEAVVAMAEDESDGQINTACGLLLIDRAASMNAGKLELKFSGVTGENDADLGDWIVTVKKSIDAHNSAREVGE